jgi:toxin CcdB
MRQFDVCRNSDAVSAEYAPYALVLQSDLFSHLQTGVVSPLLKKGEIQPSGKLNPIVEVDDEEFILSTAELVSVPHRMIGHVIGNFAARRDEVIAALDLLFLGF